jgi:hypothetical protein
MNSQEVTASYGGRMLSRMVSGKIVSVKGIDNRVAKVHSVSMGGITPKSRKSIIEVISDFRNKPQSMPTIESYMESEEVLNLKKQIFYFKLLNIFVIVIFCKIKACEKNCHFLYQCCILNGLYPKG